MLTVNTFTPLLQYCGWLVTGQGNSIQFQYLVSWGPLKHLRVARQHNEPPQSLPFAIMFSMCCTALTLSTISPLDLHLQHHTSLSSSPTVRPIKPLLLNLTSTTRLLTCMSTTKNSRQLSTHPQRPMTDLASNIERPPLPIVAMALYSTPYTFIGSRPAIPALPLLAVHPPASSLTGRSCIRTLP
jgi:hypothetical protein